MIIFFYFVIYEVYAVSMVEQYIKNHFQNKKYVKRSSDLPMGSFQHRRGWVDIPVDSEMIYSHRNTYFTKTTFTEGLHVHEYYELIIYVGGDVEYINENTLISPSPYTAIWFKPGLMHTARLVSTSQYERFVFYFTPDFFNLGNNSMPMTDFMENSESFALKIPENMIEAVTSVLKRADATCELDKPYAELLLKSYLIEIFGILNSSKMQTEKVDEFVETMAEVKRYIDEEYANILSISDIASKFFYSREHLSRKFNEAFNIHISKYLSKRRVMESLKLLERMNVTDAAYAVGFRSQSAYISAFSKNMGCLPSEYKSKHKN